MWLRVPARAKINLTLDVLGKRPDGFHQVETVMQSLALHDILEFSPGGTGLELAVPEGAAPAGPDNLVYRAAVLLREWTGTDRGVKIILRKHIPVEAGLGGGSADAAATLLTLNELWDLRLPLPELLDLGARLGSDVPFCMLGGTALARGRGELLEQLPPCPSMGVVLVKPPWGISTGAVYRAYDAGPGAAKRSTAGMLRALEEGSPAAVAGRLANDLESPVWAMYPKLGALKEGLLAAGALGALLSGSGSVVFGITADLQAARQVAARFPAAGEMVLVTETWHLRG